MRIAFDDFPTRVFAYDLASGVTQALSGTFNAQTELGCGPRLIWPRDVAVDSERQVAFVADAAYAGILAIDLRSGDRQLIAK